MLYRFTYLLLVVMSVSFFYAAPALNAITLSGAFYYTFLPFPSDITPATTTITNTTAYIYWFSVSIPLNETASFFSMFTYDPFDFYNPYFLYAGLQFEDKSTHFITKYYLFLKTKQFSYFYEGLGIFIKYDFYPNFFLLSTLDIPFYPQSLFSLQNTLPRADTSESVKFYSEAGLYFYQIELFLSFNYINTKYYKGSSTAQYDSFTSAEYGLNLRLVPTYTQLGYDIRIYYRSNYYTFSTSEQFYNNIVGAQGAIMANILDNLSFRFYIGYLFWSFTSSTITLDASANRLMIGIESYFTIK